MNVHRNGPVYRDVVHAMAVEHTCELRAEARRERMARQEAQLRTDDPISSPSASVEFAGECGA